MEKISDQDLAARQERVLKLIDSEVWKKDLLPWLEEQQELGDRAGRFHPGALRSVDEVALERAYWNGFSDASGELCKKIVNAQRDGAVARKKLEAEGKPK